LLTAALQFYLNGVFDSVKDIGNPTALPEDFNKCMADLVADLRKGFGVSNLINQLKVIRQLVTDHERIDLWIKRLEEQRSAQMNKSYGPLPLNSSSSSGNSSILI